MCLSLLTNICLTFKYLRVRLNLFRLCQLLAGDEDDDVRTPTREELLKLMRTDSILPETIQPAPIPACLPSEVKTILITGATGNMVRNGQLIISDIFVHRVAL